MPNNIAQSVTDPAESTVVFSVDDALLIAQQLAAAAVAINPAMAGGVALVTGLAELLRTTVMPAVQHLQAHEISIAEPAVLVAESAVERARVGAPPAPGN